MTRFRPIVFTIFCILMLGFDALVFALILVTFAKTFLHAIGEGLFRPPFVFSTLCVMAAFAAVIICTFLNLWSTWAQARDRNPAATLKIAASMLAALVIGYFISLKIQISVIICIIAYQALNIVQDRLYRRRLFSGAEIKQQSRNE